MLGHAVYWVLKDSYELTLAARNLEKVSLIEKFYGGKIKAKKIVSFDAAAVYQDYQDKKGAPGNTLAKFIDEIGAFDYVINAVGVTIPFSMQNPALTFFVNTALPFILAGIFRDKM